MSYTNKDKSRNHLVDYISLGTIIVLFSKGYPIGAYAIFAFLIISAFLELTSKQKTQGAVLHWALIAIFTALILISNYFFQK